MRTEVIFENADYRIVTYYYIGHESAFNINEQSSYRMRLEKNMGPDVLGDNAWVPLETSASCEEVLADYRYALNAYAEYLHRSDT